MFRLLGWCLICCGLSTLMNESVAQDRAIADFPALNADRDWPWWRGPFRNGTAVSPAAPTTFSATKNVLWKSPVPGRGHSSPIVVGDRVFLATADEQKQVQSILAYDRTTGRQLWKEDVNRGGFPQRNHPKNTEASSTIASDGERLFAAFYEHDEIGLIALSLEGKEIWKRSAGHYRPTKYEYGYAASPVLYGKTVIVIGEYDGNSFLAAFDRATGQPVWRTPRPNNISFSTPVVAHVAGKDQLLISGAEKVASYNPSNGKLLWETPGTTFATCGTMVWEGDVVYASGGYPKPETIAIRADGSGQVLWKNNQKCYEQSMLVHKGFVYGLTDNGVMYCWRGTDGQEMWKTRLKGPVSASPVGVGDVIYWANELGTMYVFHANPEKWDLIAENQLESESFASPAILGGEMFLRVASGNGPARRETLYAIGQK